MMSSSSLRKVLVRMPNWIGDAVMGSVILEELRATNPWIHFAVAAKPHILDLFKAHPSVTSFHPLDKKGKLVEEFSTNDIDHTILLTNSFSSALVGYQKNWPDLIGYRGECRNFLLSKSKSFPKEYETMHLVDVYRELLTLISITPKGVMPALFLSDEELKNRDEVLFRLGINPKKRCIVINPGAAYGLAKCWLPERFEELIQRLYKQFPHLEIVIIGDASMHAQTERLLTKTPKVTNLAGKTSLRQLMLILSHAEALITNDSGPMHMASALGKPVLAIFGSTNSTRTGPYQKGIVIQSKASCSPCYQRTCPIDFRCMKGITTDKVFELLKKLGAPWA